MKGVIFSELIRFMEQAKSAEFADSVITGANLPNDGAYTSVGNYPSDQALTLVGEASAQSGIEAAELCRLFGHYLYGRFMILYPHIMENYQTADALLLHVGSHIHAEVCTLYPDARPPIVETSVKDDRVVMRYQSHRPMAAIAFGLVQGCMEEFGDRRTLEWDIADNGKSATFTIH
ncbi:guanylate cyclase [Parasphingopyxis algicola]|uniref:heme NO-binding domain-containing protein n=1 Tax=Parasphingopyxis algicola TaxID=2026624 RepID=UPI0015A0FD8F|nr:heme NO-binding domain-containing protein [Parasphingopyxis algicola]QLC25200.1 guanylate cyclase [Parasphingopyxis algicola]